MKDIFLSLGSNKGDRKQTLLAAIREMQDMGAELIGASSIYRSEAWGESKLNDFLNMAVRLRWEIEPENLLLKIREVEMKLGRKHQEIGLRTETFAYKSRTIDIDILYMGSLIYESDQLIIPHPLLQDRLFVLLPLVELAPDFIDPKQNRSLLDLRKACKDANKVERLP